MNIAKLPVISRAASATAQLPSGKQVPGTKTTPEGCCPGAILPPPGGGGGWRRACGAEGINRRPGGSGEVWRAGLGVWGRVGRRLGLDRSAAQDSSTGERL